MKPQYIIKLHRILIIHFSKSELKTLCFYLGVNYDALPEGGLEDKARELIAHCERRNRIAELTEFGRQMRSDIVWPVIPGAVEKVSFVPKMASDEKRIEISPEFIFTQPSQTAEGKPNKQLLLPMGKSRPWSWVAKVGATVLTLGAIVFLIARGGGEDRNPVPTPTEVPATLVSVVHTPANTFQPSTMPRFTVEVSRTQPSAPTPSSTSTPKPSPTSAPTTSPTSMLALTPTLMSVPSSTSTPKPSPTPVLIPNPTSAPTSTPFLPPTPYPIPVLEPVSIIGCNVTFRWNWPGILAKDEFFAVRIGVDIVQTIALIRVRSHTYPLNTPGEYSWEIAIYRSDLAGGISEQLARSEQNAFSFRGCSPIQPFPPTATPASLPTATPALPPP